MKLSSCVSRYNSKPVAVKIIQPDETGLISPERKEKFQREVTLLSKAKHDNIVKVRYISSYFVSFQALTYESPSRFGYILYVHHLYVILLGKFVCSSLFLRNPVTFWYTVPISQSQGLEVNLTQMNMFQEMSFFFLNLGKMRT